MIVPKNEATYFLASLLRPETISIAFAGSIDSARILKFFSCSGLTPNFNNSKTTQSSSLL